MHPEPSALLAADQADNCIRLFNPFAAGDRKPDVWSYPAADGPAIKDMPTDAKRVEIEGVVHVLAAYHGRVRLIRFSDGAVIADYPSLRSCHSAELLPDGAIVTANSNDGILRLHRSETEFTDIKLPYAHGVTWDKEAAQLWALGDLLYRLGYDEGKLTIEETFPLPLTATGHDLFPLRAERKLFVSNNDALYLFDIATSKFELVSDRPRIKSASQHVDGTLWASDPTEIEGASTWQSDAVVRVRPSEPALLYRNAGCRFYKARWWQQVAFSY